MNVINAALAVIAWCIAIVIALAVICLIGCLIVGVGKAIKEAVRLNEDKEIKDEEEVPKV